MLTERLKMHAENVGWQARPEIGEDLVAAAERIEELERERDALLDCLVYQTYDNDGGGPFWAWSWRGMPQGEVASRDEGVAKVLAAAAIDEQVEATNHSRGEC